MTPDEIIAAFADLSEWQSNSYGPDTCAFCDGIFRHPNPKSHQWVCDHKPDCPWVAANKYVKENNL